MRSTVCAALLTAALLAPPALAQTRASSASVSGATSGSTSSANSTSAGGASMSSSTSAGGAGGAANSTATSAPSSASARTGSSQAATGAVTISAGNSTSTPATDPATGAPIGDPSAPFTSQTTVSGTTTLRNVPEVIPGNVVGGNPCLVGASIGGAGPGIGLTIGGGWEAAGCERRNIAAMLYNTHQADVAKALLCEGEQVREAYRWAGQPCPQDGGARVAVASVRRDESAAPVVRHEVAEPVTAAPPIVVTPVSATGPAAGSVLPAWCATTSASELASHPECRAH
jgi:hypothetical protein